MKNGPSRSPQRGDGEAPLGLPKGEMEKPLSVSPKGRWKSYN